MPTCLLVRHGRTTSNASGTLAGWTPGVDLDDVGVAQVEALGARLRELPVAAVVASPLQRCRHTADLLAAALPAAPKVVLDEGIAECRYGAWTGRPLTELAKEPLWRVVQEHPSAARFPDGADFPAESLQEMAARAVATIRRVDARVETEHGPSALWVAVSHGDIVKAVLADAAGTHLDLFQRIVVSPASLSVVTYTAGRPFLVRTNDSGADLSGLAPAKDDTAPPSGDAAVGGGS